MPHTDSVKPDDPIRVLLWSPHGAGEHYHGPGSFMYRMYNRAAPGMFEVTLAHGYEAQANYELFRAQHFIAPSGGGYFAMRRFLRASHQWLRRHAGEFDILHGLSGFHRTVEPAFYARSRGLPSVIFFASHGVELTSKRGLKNVLKLAEKRREMVKQLAAVIAMSDMIEQELRSYDIPESVIVRIPMGVDTARFRPAQEAGERSKLKKQFGWRDIPTLLFVGRMTRGKQPHVMIEAISKARKAGAECQLVLAGPESDESYTRELRETAREYEVEQHVIWFGFTQDIAPLFQAADIYGLPSLSEGMPAALVEAMSSGLPCIVTPISGTVDLIASGVNGSIIEPNSQAFADALLTYLHDPELAQTHGSRARQLVCERYSVEFVLQQYHDLFRRIIAG